MNTNDKYQYGIVMKKELGRYHVQVNGNLLPCTPSPRLRKVLVYPVADPSSLRPVVREVREIDSVDPVAVGDRVKIVNAGDGTGLLVEVLERKSALARCEATGPFQRHAREQVIVANLDQVAAVFAAAQPPPNWNLLDRYLVSAESMVLASLVVITKIDLAVNDSVLLDDIELYRRIGYRVLCTSILTGEGMEELRHTLTGKLTALIGKSGVGKTSLLNALQPELNHRVNQVNLRTGKGKHTTTNLEMIDLGEGCRVVDTPGMREYGLWEHDWDDLALLFPEMRAWVGRCKFGLDCSHIHEPGCAIRSAVEHGEIHPRRYQSMIKLREG